MGRRIAAFLAAATVAVAGCGIGETQDPYALVDRAIVVGWDRVEVHIGFSINIPAQSGVGLAGGATSITVDPRSIGFTREGETGRWRLAIALPLDSLGVDPQVLAMIAPGIDSLDLELLSDGESLFVKSPLLPELAAGLRGDLGQGVEGDLDGWVRLGDVAAMGQIGSLILPLAALPGGAHLPTLALPSPGDLTSLEQYLGDLGVALTYAGAEDADGLRAHHLDATLNLARLAESRELARLTGLGREQFQAIFDASKEVIVGADLWIDRDTGRLATFRLDAATLDAPAGRFSLIVQLTEPAAATSFDTPAEFVELDLAGLIGDAFVPQASTAPPQPEPTLAGP